MGKIAKNIFYIIVAFLVITGLMVAFSGNSKVTDVPLSKIKDDINAGTLTRSILPTEVW